MLELLTDPAVWISFLTLVALEIVLGVDNLILISILTDKLPKHQQPAARRLGIVGAVITRIMLIALAFKMVHMTQAAFTILGNEFSWSDILLIIGGLFLLGKGTVELHNKVEGEEHNAQAVTQHPSFNLVVGQIMIMDLVFSFDSVLTAVGVADHLPVMVAAILISVLFMLIFAEGVHGFIARHPTVKVLALSYMLLIGMALIADGLGFHIPKGYLYFAMGFSFSVEALNMVIRGRKTAKVLSKKA